MLTLHYCTTIRSGLDKKELSGLNYLPNYLKNVFAFLFNTAVNTL